MTHISVLIQNVAGPEGKVLIGKKDDGKWALPADVLHTGEDPARACIRIAWEQLHIDVRAGKLEMRGLRKKTGGCHEYFSAVCTRQQRPDDGWFVETAWVHPMELDRYEFDGDDGKFMAKYVPWLWCRQIPDVRLD